MTWLLLCVLTGAAFGHIMRHAQVRSCGMPWVGAWNYLAAAAASWVWLALQPGGGLIWDAAVLGTLSGLGLVTAFFFMDYAIATAGVGVTMAAQWLGVSVPVAASIIIWREIPGAVQAVGLALALISFPLLAHGPSAPGARGSRWKVLFLAALFLLEGIVGLAMKIYSQRAPAGSESAFLCFMFSAAAAGNVLAAVRTARPGAREMAHGFGMGACNVVCCLGLLRALALLPGTIVFPTTAAGGVALTAATGALLWGERYHGRSLVGLILAVISLILINA